MEAVQHLMVLRVHLQNLCYWTGSIVQNQFGPCANQQKALRCLRATSQDIHQRDRFRMKLGLCSQLWFEQAHTKVLTSSLTMLASLLPRALPKLTPNRCY